MLRRIPRFIHHFIYIPTNESKPFSYLHPTLNSFSYSTIISQSQDALNYALQQMSLRGCDMKIRDYDALLHECANRKSLSGGQRVQAHMMKTHYHPHIYLRTRLLVLYVKCDVLNDAGKVFDEMPERNVVSWTALISGYSKNGCHSEVLNLFIQMQKSEINPNEYTFATVLISCVGEFGLKHGRQIHSLIVKTSYELHMYVGSSLLDMYAKAGSIHEARIVFDCLPKRDVVSCTAVLAGYTHLGLDQEALDLFRTLHGEARIAPNCVTYATLLTALSGLAALEYGRQVHARVLRSQQIEFIVLQNSLIDMYAKCGNLSYARKIFDKMPDRTVVSWNAILAGYSKHGNGKAVVNLYNAMNEENKIPPDSTTLLTVLSGCSHGGMENVGLKIFYRALENDGITLGIEHYGCVVDLLGRAGQLEKALKFIHEMPCEPNAAIWGSLLGACKVHRNAKVGIIAGNRLLEIEPENAGNYVILCNLYASDKTWDKVREVRERMKGKALSKVPGKSWIEFGQRLHVFYSEDRGHPRREDIMKKVMEMLERIKGAGYCPDLSSVLHDVDEEQKERSVLGHSEKLALAYGMMNVTEGKTIRIMKNLRICVDCHNFAKFVSMVFEREIIVRDKSRFHHIVGGACSCLDYW